MLKYSNAATPDKKQTKKTTKPSKTNPKKSQILSHKDSVNYPPNFKTHITKKLAHKKNKNQSLIEDSGQRTNYNQNRIDYKLPEVA